MPLNIVAPRMILFRPTENLPLLQSLLEKKAIEVTALWNSHERGNSSQLDIRFLNIL
jgi:hypothetical protein